MINGLNKHMSPIECRNILKYRLMILLLHIDEVCSVFHKVFMDSLREQTIYSIELLGFKYIYEFIRVSFLIYLGKREYP